MIRMHIGNVSFSIFQFLSLSKLYDMVEIRKAGYLRPFIKTIVRTFKKDPGKPYKGSQPAGPVYQ